MKRKMCLGSSALSLGQKVKSCSLLPVLCWFAQLFKCIARRFLLLPRETISQLLQLSLLSKFPDIWKWREWDENLSYRAIRILIGRCKSGFVLLNIYWPAKPKHSEMMSQVVWKSRLTQESRAFQNNKCQSLFLFFFFSFFFFNIWIMTCISSPHQ